MGHQLTPGQVDELNALMEEYPDWAKINPEIAASLHQPRFHKSRKYEEKTTARVMPRRTVVVPKSDYQAIYNKTHAPRVRSSKKPREPMIEHCRLPMSFATNQRDEFVPKDPSVRPQLIVLKETYEHPSGAFEGETSYNKAYVPIEIKAHHAQHPHPTITDGQIKANTRNQGSFSGKTTNKESYKKWVTKPAMKFTELPSFTGSLLYPELGHDLASTTKTTYKGQQTERVGLIRHSYGHIQLEGDHDMSTTTKSTYRSFDHPQAAVKIVRPPQMPVRRRGTFKAKSQSQTDYGSCYSGGAPVPPPPVTPHPETIELRFNNKTHFCTEQQSQYPGIDVATHPPPRPIVPEAENYTASAGGKIESESRSRSDYKAHDVSVTFVPPVKPITESQRRSNLPPFHSETSNSHFYKNWNVEPRRRYVDFHEGHKYIPPQGKFEGISTTQTTYAGEQGEVAEPFHPVENASLRGEGIIDFGTMYKNSYSDNSPLKKLNKQQMERLLIDLRRRKQQENRFTEQQVMFAQGVGSI